MNTEVGSLIEDCEELIRMLTAIVKTAQKKLLGKNSKISIKN
jgi:hypothetical protein